MRRPAPRDWDDALPDYRAVYNGRGTFLGVPAANIEDEATYAGKDVVIVGAPFDGGTSYRPGARFGPQAIRSADYLPMAPYRPHLDLGIDAFSALSVVDCGDVPMPPGSIEESLARLEGWVARIAGANATPIILGGDHSIAAGGMKGIARKHGGKKIGVVHFDAHADTGDKSDFGSLWGHGTPMRRAVEAGVVRSDRFVQFGLRGYWPGPATLAWAKEQGMRSYTMERIVLEGLGVCLTEAIAHLSDCDGVYLSIDVDCVDPSMAPGTGTPEPGGLTSRELFTAVRALTKSLPIVAADVVEVSPPYDGPGAPTAALGNRIVLEILSGIAFRSSEKEKS